MLTESAGIINATHLPEAYAAKVTPKTGIMAPVIQDFQKAHRKKRDTARGGILTILSHQRDEITFYHPAQEKCSIPR